MVETIADTIIWMGGERFKTGKYQNKASALYAVLMEVNNLVGEEMESIKVEE